MGIQYKTLGDSRVTGKPALFTDSPSETSITLLSWGEDKSVPMVTTFYFSQGPK